MNERSGGSDTPKRKGRSNLASVPAPIIIGIGASAGSLDSLERFFSNFTLSEQWAVVLVVQHREALNTDRLQRTLAERADLRLSEISNGAPAEGGKIYLCEPNRIVTLEGGRFLIREAQQAPGERGTVDSFLVSLAHDIAERAVGVVLHGTAGDGTLGVATLKEQGGLTIAEPGPGETVVELTTSNSAGALADFLLHAQDIPERLTAYTLHLERVQAQKGFDAILSAAEEALTSIAGILRTRTGHDFHGYKKNTFLRRIQRRMQVVQVSEIDAYLQYLREHSEEVQSLFNDLLIGVTQFFRDRKEFELLETKVIPEIFAGKTAEDQIRVWVLGCATGEEAYSLAILLREYMQVHETDVRVQIFATDIDGRALAAARVGRYSKAIASDVTPERLARWFLKEGETYCVAKELREMCIFSAHNVIRDAPFSRLDLISCRNLLIYLDGDLQNRIIPLFHFALLPNRYLFLGNAENVTRHPKLFTPVDRRARIFRRVESSTRIIPEFPISRPSSRRPVELPTNTLTAKSQSALTRRAERVVERYTPAYVIADERFQVLHFSGRTGRYLDPTTGAASLDLINLVHRDLRADLRAALHRAADEGQPVRVDGLQLGVNGNRLEIEIIVEPVRDKPDDPGQFIVVFKEGGSRPETPEEERSGHALLSSEHVQRLESDLRVTRDRLQATIEELESTNEELKSSNEEYQSLNEELQSANEELETSREELQSVNEELTTVNGELSHRVQELTRTSSDLKNFLESTRIATLFLDNDMRVMNFTPAVSEIFHLVEGDIGRPIAHIKSRIAFEELHEDIRGVQRNLSSIERDVENPATGSRYIVRVLPYRSVDNFIAGVVLTFVDVTALTRAEERQRLLVAELQHRVRNTIAVIRSIARRTAKTSDTVEDYASHFDGRINAFARVQSAVTRNPTGGLDLAQLVADELLTYAAQEGKQLRLDGPDVRLQPKAAETLGLALHELATNAVKHGPLGRSDGKVCVSWKILRDGGSPVIALEWKERGKYEVPTQPLRKGFGTDLLERTLAYEMKAQVNQVFEPDGLRCTIKLPLTERLLVE